MFGEIGKTFDGFSALVSQKLRDEHLPRWNELTKKRIFLKTRTNLFVKVLRVRVRDCTRVIQDANDRKDLEDSLNFLNCERIKTELKALINEFTELQQLLIRFQTEILERHYNGCETAKKITLGIAAIILGIGCFVLCWWIAVPAACAVGPAACAAAKTTAAAATVGAAQIIGGGAAAIAGVCAVGAGAHMLTKKTQLEKLGDILQKEVTGAELINDYLENIYAQFGLQPGSMRASHIKASLQKRLQEIDQECEKVILFLK